MPPRKTTSNFQPRRPAKARPSKGGPSKASPKGRRPARPDRPERRSAAVPDARGGRIPQAPPLEIDEADDPAGRMRLQKFLAMAGVDSRRNCEEYIRTGRVTVDSEVVTDPARSVNPETQDVRLDSERLRMPRFRYFLVNKPKGVLCTNRDPQGRPRAIDLVPVADQRFFTVGRLDENTEGMLLITNDGDLAQKLAHPRFEVIRRYHCHVAGIPQPETLKQLREGMYFAEGYFKFRGVRSLRRRGQSVILELELQEGKNREIRRLMARVGHKVLSLERVAFGPLTLGSLAPGRHRELQPFEVHELRHFAEHGKKPADRGPRPNDGFGYRSGQTRGGRRRPTPNKDRGEKTGNIATETTVPPRSSGPKKPVRAESGPVRTERTGTAKSAKSASTRKAGPKKPFRPSTQKPATSAINKGRDRRKNR